MSRTTRTAVQVSDACRVLSSSRSTIYRLIRAGELDAIKGKGRTSKYLIYEDSIEAYQRRRAVTPAYDRKRIRELLAA
ncbi:helix-turn-helix domain-containing protein [Nesterenkonia sp. HG001]|uniref:helix-turn-helix domain-containing protein n=1 Tax=Nesterenkonia sp. HG001 TaxID=2983207 RepID=UPI002AC4B655|nr:helix-turn-helix domain-containing protein [Nesterenkonia sp. HG001]MDZ5077899.1 helix-turn-helix domain-containing protein [Nesterenkonia sp. HG001]